jgi:RHS repeat-associated protein
MASFSNVVDTLYLGDTQLHVAPGSSTVTAVRTYSVNGTPIAERDTQAGVSGSVLDWLVTDQQNNTTAEVSSTTGAATRRYQDPYGNAVGSAVTWSSQNGFLNAPTSSFTALTILGARMYDATVGRFLSVDPVLSPDDPQQNNGYSYSHNSPIDLSDPSGLTPRDLCAIAANECGKYAPSGGSKSAPKAPPAPGQAFTQGLIHEGSEPLEWLYEQGGPPSAWLLGHADFTQDAEGIIRTTANPWQLKHGYRNFFDTVFSYTTPNKPQIVEFTLGQKSYEIRSWVGNYPAIGDGGEIEFLSQNTPHPDMDGKWNAVPDESDAPSLTESVSSGGSTIESSAPMHTQPWVNGWNPNKQLNDSALEFTGTVTFPSAAMATAFRGSVIGNSGWSFPSGSLTATLSYRG